MDTVVRWFKPVVFITVCVSLAFFWMAQNQVVDTEAMRNVSVSIRAISHVNTDTYGDSVWEPSSGSGFLVSTHNCEVWTNHHVIQEAAIVEVFPRGWKASQGIPTRIVNSNPQLDVAILQMESCENIPAARLGNSDAVMTGDETFVVGNPFGHNPDSVSRGIISHTKRFLSAPNAYFQTDAAVNPGNSGGALFDKKGVAIGLTTAIANNKSGNNVGISYALPMNSVIDVVAELRKGPPSWGDAGLNGNLAALNSEEAAVFNVPHGGAAVSVMHDPAEGPSVGHLQARDIIYQVDDTPVVNGPSHVRRLINSKKPGDQVIFSFIRNGELKTTIVTLSNGWDKQQTIAHDPEPYSGLLGLNVEMWQDYGSYRGRYTTPVITKIHSMGPAHRGYIASSQSSVARRGTKLMPIQLTVKTITGAVLEGKYQPITDIAELDHIADKAYKAKQAILLEIENWQRDPNNLNAPLKRSTSAFYRIVPSPSAKTTSNSKSEYSDRNS